MADSRSEPSMDEILSSIKKIIADEDRAKPGTRKRAAAPAAAVEDDSDDEILELTEIAESEQENEILLDNNKAQSLARSFSTLQTLAEPGAAPQIVRSGETSLEGLARELMKPMLKEWLDTNLPALVEAMVEREISRITKKG
jgi:uncharacterized protein